MDREMAPFCSEEGTCKTVVSTVLLVTDKSVIYGRVDYCLPSERDSIGCNRSLCAFLQWAQTNM